MEVIITYPGNHNFHLFDDIVKQLYPADSIRHLQPENLNLEFLLKCYILIHDGKSKARAALYNNPNLSFNRHRATCIGNYECVDDKEVAKNLLEYITDECRKAGYRYIIGPMNGSTWDNYRFSTNQQNHNFFLEPYHHFYYNNQFIDNGFEVLSNYASYKVSEIHCDTPKVLKREMKFKQAGVKFRNIDINDFEKELKLLYPFILNAFKNNFLYTPVKWETFRSKYIEAAKIIDNEYVLIAENKQKEIIGFIFCYNDIFNKMEKSLVIKTIARDNSEEWSGMGYVLVNQIMKKVKKEKYKTVIHAFMIEEGSSNKISKKYQSEFYKTYKLYGKPI